MTALVNSLAFGITATSDYKPTAFWGALMALTMAMAFAGEALLLPACIRSGRRYFQPEAAPEAIAAGAVRSGTSHRAPMGNGD